MQSQPIVDAHYHLWDLSKSSYPWLHSDPPPAHIGDLAPLRHDYSPQDYKRDLAGWNVVACVNVEAGVDQPEPLAESRWLNGTLANFDLPTVLVAHVDLLRPDAAVVLAGQARVGRVRGIRMRFRQPSDLAGRTGGGAAILGDAIWRSNFARLPDHGFSFDLQAPSDLMTEAATLAREFPEITMILTHAGLPLDRSAKGLSAWRHGLKRLAQQPNVLCKISGLAMLDHSWTVQRLRPIIRPLVDEFGPSRCMFGSNFPVDRLFGSFGAIISAYAEALGMISNEDLRAIFHDTAMRAYRLGSETSPRICGPDKRAG